MLIEKGGKMRKILFTFVLLSFLAPFSILAGFPNIPHYSNYEVPHTWFCQDRANFTWNWVGPEGGSFNRIIVDPQNNNLALSLSEGGDLWRTIDGNSWIVVPDFMYRNPMCALFTAPDTAIVTVWDTLYNTVNGGDN